MTTDDEGRDDLIEEQGVNAGSVPAERDRRPDGHIEVRPATSGPVREGDEPAEQIVGAPGQQPGVPGQQMHAGEG